MAMAIEKRLASSLARLAENTEALWTPKTVPRRPFASLSVLEFVRDFVSASQPLVLTDLAAEDWPCLARWSDEYLLGLVGDTKVSVNFTPGGFGDFVDAEGRFVKPLEERMRFRDFWARLDHEKCRGGDDGPPTLPEEGVPYLSEQNDSLREQFPDLVGDIPAVLPLGAAAFNNEPEAVNLWIGDGRSVTSCHKDHYENLHAVVRGEKIFTLLPPAAIPFLHERKCASAQFERRPATSGSGLGPGALEAVPDVPASEVAWVPVEVAEPDLQRHPMFAQASAVDVSVRSGEMLYIPAMWYHRVAQRGVTVSVNYWHDMQFGHLYVHNQFLRDVIGLCEHEVEVDGEGAVT